MIDDHITKLAKTLSYTSKRTKLNSIKIICIGISTKANKLLSISLYKSSEIFLSSPIGQESKHNFFINFAIKFCVLFNPMADDDRKLFRMIYRDKSIIVHLYTDIKPISIGFYFSLFEKLFIFST